MILNPDHPWAPTISGLWLPGANGRTGYTLRDLSGRHNHGTLTNGPTWDSRSHVGGFGSINFDGSNDHIDVPGTTSSDFMLLKPFTMACWVQYTGATSLESAMSIGRGFRKIEFRTRFTGSQIELVRDADIANVGGDLAPLGTGWRLLTGTYDGTTLRLFVDGIEKASVASGSLSDASPTTWKIGADANGTSTWQGLIGFAMVAKRAFSPSEVWHLYEESLQGYPALLNWYRPKRYFFMDAGGGGGPVWKPLSLLGVG